MRSCTGLIAAGACTLAFISSVQASRFESYTKQYKDPPDPVTVEAATYLGSAGSEWLAGGGFAHDGTVVVGGTSWGPSLEIAGSEAVVLGSSQAAPALVELQVDSKGRKVFPDWRHPNGTPFVAWFTPGIKSVARVVRLPWQTGPATDIRVDGEGAVYIAGMTGPNFDGAVKAESVSTNSGENTRAFVIKLAPDGSKIIWARTFADAGKGVRLRLHNGRILAEGGWVYVFMPDGRMERVAEVGKAGSWRRAVNPVDFSFCFGYDRNTKTGREPWRQPCLHIAPAPDDAEGGKEGRNLYQWDPKLVGSSKYRLVSDSSFKAMHYTDDGMLWAAGWSDGGNTVLTRSPLNLDEGISFKGLGFSAWGAGALSLAHIIKINPKTYEVASQTLWCGYLSGKDKPNSVTVDRIDTATDGSVLLSGGSAFGFIQTGNALHPYPDAPGGPYIAVLKSDLSSIRFSSSMLACGKVSLSDDGAKWNTISGVAGGRHKVLFLTSAIEKEGAYAEAAPAPARNAVQEHFAGGECDGYLVLMDLGPVQ
jgi:hypothetical protein